MHKILRMTLGLGMMACIAVPLSALSAPVPERTVDWDSVDMSQVVPGELLVRFNDSAKGKLNAATATARLNTHAAVGAQLAWRFRTIPWDAVKLPPGLSLEDAAQAYTADPSVAYVEPNYIVHAIDTVPDDPDYNQLWGMERIQAPRAWDVSTGNSNMVVAVIDTGIRATHEDLEGNMWTNPDEIAGNGEDDDGNGFVDDVHGWDFVNDDNDPDDDQGHGTHCAGTVGGVGDNGVGVAGVNWNVKLVAVKFLSSFGSGSTADAIKSVEYVNGLSQHIRLSNNSWGGGGYSMALEEAIRAGGEANQLFIAAAGNSSTDNDVNPHYPSSYDLDNIIAVASITSGGGRSSFSCYGKESVDIGAPGSEIYSTEYDSNSSYGIKSGTSMACPHVAGAAALIWGQNLAAGWTEVRDAILDTAEPNPALTGRVVTDGELNVAEAIGQIAGALTLDQLAYQSDALVGVTLADANESNDVVEVDWITITSNNVERHRSELDLHRIVDTFFFTNSLQLTSGVTAVDGDLLRVSHGASSNSVVATAPIDDVPPVISNLRTLPLDVDSQVIAWDTDESASALALVAATLPPDTNTWTGTDGFADWGSDQEAFPHTVTVEELQERTVYYYAVRSADPAGNETVQPVDLSSTDPQDYQRFVTRYLQEVSSDDFEGGEGEWSHSGLNDCWEYGVPSFGPTAAYSGSNCWGTCLGDYYPNLMNAWLVSSPVDVGEGGRLTFMTWYQTEEGFDTGYVEADWGSGWNTLLSLTGNSLGEWRQITVQLPEEVAHKVVQFRFRMQSDYSYRYAGWYIDDVVVAQVGAEGIDVLEWVNPVDDRQSYDPDNDADGYPETGETFDLNFRVFNSGPTDFENVISRVDCPADAVDIDPGRDTIEFRSVAFGDLVAGGQGIRVTLDDSPSEPLTGVPFIHTITADGGHRWENVIYLDFSAREAVSGFVTNLSGAPIAGATVKGTAAGFGGAQATSLANGSYVLNGLEPGVGYDVYAFKTDDYGAAPLVTVTGPAQNVNFGLGRAFADASPSELSVSVEQTGYADVLLTVANTNALADQALVVSPIGVVDSANISISFPGVPAELTVAPGTAETVTVRVMAEGAAVGAYDGTVWLIGNAVHSSVLEIPVAVDVQPGPVLDLFWAFPDDSITGDNDGYVDPGESVEAWLLIDNFGEGAANSVTGVLSFTGTTGVVAVTGSDLDFGTIAAGDWGFGIGEFDVDPAAEHGLELPFGLELWDAAGNYWEFSFSFTVETYSSITGTVIDAGTSLPLAGVGVTAVSATDSASDVTEVDGSYALHGMVDGVYTVSVTAPPGYASAPSLECVLADSDCEASFALAPLDIAWTPDSFSKTVQEGREAHDTLTISNGSSVAVEVRLNGAMKDGALIDPGALSPLPSVDWAGLSEEDARTDRIIVRFRDSVDVAAMNSAAAAVGGKVVRRLRSIPAALVSLPPGRALTDAASLLAADASVAYVQPDYRYKLDAAPGTPRREPDDTYYGWGWLWGLDNYGQDDGTQDADIDAAESWYLTTGDTNVIVAVLDTGIDWEHPDLVDNLWMNPGETGLDTNGNDLATNNIDDDLNGYVDDVYGWNFLYSTNGGWYEGIYANGMPVDDHGHGTHVSGTIGAVGNNDEGVVGVNWQVRLMALKIGDFFGYIDAFAAAEALEYAVDKGADVSNNSWGGLQMNYLFHEMVALARDDDQLVVCAAGNDGTDNDQWPHYPSSDESENIVSVAATDRDGVIAYFSNWGENSVDIAAPGVSISSTYPDGSYMTMGGTSMACPHVAGVAALLRAYAPHAGWEMIKAAIMDGANVDPRLERMMRTEGHLNAYDSLRLLSGRWMAFDPATPVVPAGGNTDVDVTFNVDGILPPGRYEADIVLASGDMNTNRIPVELEVAYAPIPRYASVRVDDSAGDNDGYPEPGEQVDLYVAIQNRGSLTLSASSGTLTETNDDVTVDSGAMSWAGIESMDATESVMAATVTFGSGVGSNVTFTFDVDDGVNPPWEGLSFTLGVGDRYSVSGTVMEQVTLNPVSASTVEFYGASAGSVESGIGGTYVAHGLRNGTYKIRARKNGYGRGEWNTLIVAGGDAVQDLYLGIADGAVTPENLDFALLSGQAETSPVTIANAGLSRWIGTIHEIARRKVAVISDGDRLTGLESLLAAFGLDVDGFADNAEEYYTAQEGTLSEYDLVIADMGGPEGLGRKIVGAEGYAIENYVSGGGYFIATGRNILGQPDNQELGWLVGTSTLGLQREHSTEAVVSAATDAALNGPYAAFDEGDRMLVASNRLDLVTADTNQQAVALLAAGSGDKIVRRRLGAGVIVYWGGQHAAAEWTSAGPLQELFRNLVLDLLSGDVSWLQPQAAAFDLAAAEATELDVRVEAMPGSGLAGTNTAALLLVGNLPDQPDRSVVVTLITKPVALRVESTTGVRRWDDTFLEGDGGVSSCLFQLIDAGADGQKSPADLDGGTTGDDVLLRTLEGAELYGRFGDRYELEPDRGLFSRRFSHNLLPDRKVFVRAWDASTFAGAVAYGDSALYPLQRIAGETHDFGTWTVETSLDFPGNDLDELRDQDGDGIPDGWALRYGLDPRNTIGPLTPEVTVVAEASGFDKPGRVAVWSNFVFVADTENNRIVVLSRDLDMEYDSFGSYGTGAGSFDSPQGVAVYGSTRKVIVADTDNHRVQVLDVNPSDGTLSYAGQFGSIGSGDGQFDAPYAVEVSRFSGRIYVADSYPSGVASHRVQRFSSSGSWELSFGVSGTAAGQFNRPLGIALDSGGLLYTAEMGNHRVQCMTSTGIPLWQTGTQGAGAGNFESPRDVGVGTLHRLYVADTSNHRIEVYRIDGAPGSIVQVGSFGDFGEDPGEFKFPQGVCALSDEAGVYVADTFNGRVQLLSFIMDNDGDGMDDMWEDANGLDSTDPDDWGVDSDHDGLINIGEYRIGTDPWNGDTNGDGIKDGRDVALGNDPTAPFTGFRIMDTDAAPDRLMWNARSGASYRIQFALDLMLDDWRDTGLVNSASESVLSWTNPAVPTNRIYFYRAIEKE